MVMKIALLFGIHAPSLDAARDLLEDALAIEMEGRDSLHWGGEYYRYDPPGTELILQSNLTEDYVPAEPDYAEYPFMLHADVSRRSPFLAQLLRAPDVFVKLRIEKEYDD